MVLFIHLPYWNYSDLVFGLGSVLVVLHMYLLRLLLYITESFKRFRSGILGGAIFVSNHSFPVCRIICSISTLERTCYVAIGFT